MEKNIDILTELILDDLFLIKQLFFKIYTSGERFQKKYYNIDMSGFWDTIHGKSDLNRILFIKEPSLINKRREFFLFISKDFKEKHSNILQNKKILINFLKQNFELKDLTEENHLQIVEPFLLSSSDVLSKYISIVNKNTKKTKILYSKKEEEFQKKNEEYFILNKTIIEPIVILSIYKKISEITTIEELQAIQNPQLLYNFVKTEILNIGEYDTNEQIVDKIILNPKLLKRIFVSLIEDKLFSIPNYGRTKNLEDYEIMNYQNNSGVKPYELFIVSKNHKMKKRFTCFSFETLRRKKQNDVCLHRIKCNSYNLTPPLISNILVKLNHIGKMVGYENTITKMDDFMNLSRMTCKYLEKTEN